MDDQALKNYFLFDEADLNANRNGQLSEKQRKALEDINKGGRNITIGIGIFFLIIACIWPLISFMPLALASMQNHPVSTQVNFIGPIVWALVWGALGGYIIFRGFSNSNPEYVIKKKVGPVNFVAVAKSTSGGEVEYSLRIGKEKFDVVDATVPDIIPKGDTYAIYFYELNDGTGKHITSLEWLSKG